MDLQFVEEMFLFPAVFILCNSSHVFLKHLPRFVLVLAAAWHKNCQVMLLFDLLSTQLQHWSDWFPLRGVVLVKQTWKPSAADHVTWGLNLHRDDYSLNKSSTHRGSRLMQMSQICRASLDWQLKRTLIKLPDDVTVNKIHLCCVNLLREGRTVSQKLRSRDK